MSTITSWKALIRIRALRVGKEDRMINSDFLLRSPPADAKSTMALVGVKGYVIRAATCRAHAQATRRAGHLAARDGTTVSVNQNGECDEGSRRMAVRLGRARVSLNGMHAMMWSTWLASTIAATAEATIGDPSRFFFPPLLHRHRTSRSARLDVEHPPVSGAIDDRVTATCEISRSWL